MKKIQYTASVLSCFVLIACADKDDATPADTTTVRKYDVSSGTIHFDTDLAGFKGSKIVYFDNYGAKERVETSEDGLLKSTLLSDGKTRYNLDVAAKTAYIIDHYGQRGWEMEFDTWEEIQQLPDYQEHYKKVDNITVVGKNCEAFQYDNNAIFAGWKGLTLYHKQNPGILIQAVKLEENVIHDPVLFKISDRYILKELP